MMPATFQRILTITSVPGLLFALRDDGAVFVLRTDIRHEWQEVPPVPGSLRDVERTREIPRVKDLTR